MSDYGQVKWKDFNKDVSCRDLYVFGAGARGARIAELVNDGVFEWKIKAFIDNSSERSEIYGYEVLSPEILQEKDPDSYVVLISLHYPGIVSRQLNELGAVHCYSYFFMTEGGRAFIKQDLTERSEIKLLKELLCDESSKYLLDKIIEKRLNGAIDYTDISGNKSEYFIDDIFSRSDSEVFLDGGAFDGDTIDEFYNWTKGKYKEIYAFEVDQRMIQAINNKMYRWHDVHLIDKGLWSESTRLQFAMDNKILSSHITSGNEENMNYIDCISFEEQFGDNVPLSFIKLDIEGAEIEAINGMKNIIRKFKPKLAISIYHKPEDLWQIPIMLHELVPEYKLYIRHFGHNYYGTNVYAVV